jgi:hypothetical protein
VWPSSMVAVAVRADCSLIMTHLWWGSDIMPKIEHTLVRNSDRLITRREPNKAAIPASNKQDSVNGPFITLG